MTTWIRMNPRATLDHVGCIPEFLSESDPDSAVQQLHKNYAHGGGWHSLPGFTLGDDCSLRYPGDPPLRPLWRTRLRRELIIVYECAFVAVIQSDRSFDVSRMD